MTKLLLCSDTCPIFRSASSGVRRLCMHEMWSSMKAATNRRSFLKNGLATAAGVGLLANNSFALAEDDEKSEHSGRLTFGDAAMLRFAAAAEIIETDLWVQYNELCGVQDREEPDGTGNPAFTNA